MKKQKVEKKFIYEGLGFPVILFNVPLIELRGTWTLDIDLNILQKVVLLALVHKPSNLTGNQVSFIRLWLGLTQSEFGKLFGVTHPAVVKWEKAGNKGSNMNLTTQRDLRLLAKDDDFRRGFKIIHATDYSLPIQPLELDVPTELVAV